MTEFTRRQLLKFTGVALSRLSPVLTPVSTAVAVAYEAACSQLARQHKPTSPTSVSPIYPVTQAEQALGITPPFLEYAPGDVRRQGAKCDNSTDDTAAINQAANIARQANANGGGPNYIEFRGPGACRVSASVNFSTIDAYGYGEGLHIRATNAQFDLVTSTGNTQFIGLRIDGGWDGKTSGLSGDTVSIQAVAPAHPYVINFHNCQFVNNKSRGVYIERGGYTSFTGNNIILGCGLHAVECFGLRTDACTTITTAGTCQWGACPNGYSIKLTECAKCTFRDVISEDTQGYQLNGLDNRAITFDGCYQENFHGENPTGLFLNDNSSGGIGLVVRSCFGGNLALPFFANWQDVYISGNSNLAESAVPFANRIVQADSGQKETAAHGGVSVTVTSVSLPPGTWDIDGTLQTADAGSCVLRDASFVLTTDLTKTGAASGTSAGFEIGTARVPNVPASPATRLNASKVYQNTTSGDVTLYMRAFLNASGGILAYRGVITAKRFN